MCTPSRNSNSVKVIHFCFIKNRDENSERLQVIIDICKYIVVEKKGSYKNLDNYCFL